MREQRTSSHLLKDKVEEVCLLKELNKLDNRLLPATQVVKFNLPKDLWPVERARGLPDDLHGKLLPGEDVDAGLHLAVVALPQQLPGQAVLVGEGGAEASPGRPLLLPPPQLLPLSQGVSVVLNATPHILLRCDL